MADAETETRHRSRAVSACLLLTVLPLTVVDLVVQRVLNERYDSYVGQASLIKVQVRGVEKANAIAEMLLSVCWLALAVGLAVAALLVLRHQPAGRPLATGFAAILVLWPSCCGVLEAGDGSGEFSFWAPPVRGLTTVDLTLKAAGVLVAVAGVLCAYLPRERRGPLQSDEHQAGGGRRVG